MKNRVEGLRAKYSRRRGEIRQRLLHFKRVGASEPKILFEELAFCILTPQSKALSCDSAIRELAGQGLLFSGQADEIAAVLAKKTRFHNNKARYLVGAREKFSADGFGCLEKITFEGDAKAARLALLKSVKGIGMKEASHYLRNVGRGENIAILDRHILKNLVKHGAIARLPKSLTQKKYLEIEKLMSSFCRKARIPMGHLDLLFWAEETGHVFK
jgi:N-glycosylase/DNA lyase